MPIFDAALAAEYARLWASMVVRPERAATVNAIARRLYAHKPRYAAVAERTGVPWHVIAGLHQRESDADFTTYLGNGEPLGRVTRLVPRGRGPFASWEEGAIDALSLDGLDQVKEWSAARICFETEKFNGFGYHRRGLPSPYLWSFTNHYQSGKYVADGVFDRNAVDKQCGAIPVMKQLIALDGRVDLPVPKPVPVPEPQPQPKPPTKPPNKPPVKEPGAVTGIGGLIAAIAHALGAPPAAVVAILFLAAGVAAFLYFRKRPRS